MNASSSLLNLYAVAALLAGCTGGNEPSPTIDAATGGDACATCTDDGGLVPDGPMPRGWRETQLSFVGLHVLWVAPTHDVYVAGSSMRHRTPDGVWHLETHPFSTNSPSESVYEMWGSSATDIYAVGTSGNIEHSTGNGTWTQIPRFMARNCHYLDAVWGSGPNDVYVGGMSASQFGDVGPCILHWDGQAWADRTPPFPIGEVHSIWGTGPDDVWAAAGAGVMFHRDASGTWTRYVKTETHGPEELTSIWGSGPNNIYVGGVDGGMIRWNGTSWQALPNVSTGTPNVRQIWGTSAQDIYVVTDVAAYHSTGGAFTPFITELGGGPPNSASVYDVWGTSASDVFVLGAYGSFNYLVDGP